MLPSSRSFLQTQRAGRGSSRRCAPVFPGVALMPTGGIGPEDAQAYLDAGAICIGMGGNLLPSRELESGDTDGARARIRTVLNRLNRSER